MGWTTRWRPVPYAEGLRQIRPPPGPSHLPAGDDQPHEAPARRPGSSCGGSRTPPRGPTWRAYLYNLPQYKAALDSPRLTALPGFSALLPLMRSKVTLVADPIAPVGDQYNSVVNSYTNAILSGQTSPAAAMGAVRQRIQPQLDKIVAKGH